MVFGFLFGVRLTARRGYLLRGWEHNKLAGRTVNERRGCVGICDRGDINRKGEVHPGCGAAVRPHKLIACKRRSQRVDTFDRTREYLT